VSLLVLLGLWLALGLVVGLVTGRVLRTVGDRYPALEARA
jgi:hypothetical protein